MKYIITHPGKAHRDEVLAIALLLGYFETNLTIQRKEPSRTELNDPKIIVIDVGGRYEVANMNFDHHQFTGEKKPRCALTLILSYLQMNKEAQRIWPWLEPTEIYDARGPNYFNQYYKVNPSVMSRMKSPIEEGILEIFGQKKSISPSDTIYKLLKLTGNSLYGQLSSIHQRLKSLKADARVWKMGPVKIMDTRKAIEEDEDITFGVNIFCKEHHPDIDIIISHDDRGENGVSLYRRKGEDKIDFTQIEDRQGVYFSHKNGFLAKVKRDVDLLPLIQKSLIDEQKDKQQTPATAT